MTEPDGAAVAPEESAPSERNEQAPPADDLSKLKAEARKWEQRAKENKAAADELAKLKQSQMSEAERVTARLAELEQEAQTARSEALRFRIATRYGISDDDADLFLTGADEETLERQAKALAERTASAAASTTPAGPRPDLSQGARDIPLNGDPIENRLKAALGIS